MKKKYFYIFLLITISLSSFGQTTADFRSIASGTWSSISSWQTWNGGWVPAISYPGQNAGTYNVTIESLHTITISSNLSTAQMGFVTVNGTLNLSPSTSPNTITLLTPNLDINSGTLNFDLKVRLNFPSSSILTLENGGKLTTTNSVCNNNQKIYIGEKQYAACIGGGSSVYTFGEVAASGGNVNTKIIAPSTNIITALNCFPDLTGGYTGTETNVTYKWKVRNPNGTTTTIDSGTLSSDSQTTSTSFTPTILGEYLVSLEITTTASATNIETRIIDVVSPVVINTTVKTAYNGADLSCLTATDAVITVTATGGTGTITYSKDNGASFQASNVFSGLAAGTYQIRVKDVNLCVSAPTAVNITAPNPVVIGSAVKTLYNTAELSCATATDGEITVTATGGTGTITYSKDNGASFQASNVFSGLATGTYQIRVRDTNSCVSAPTAVNITAPNPVVISSAIKTLYNTAELSCATATDSEITVTATGGTGTITYSKDNGASFQASNVFSGLAAGTYQIRVRDANSCVSDPTAVNITAPNPVVISSAVKTLYNTAELSCATATDGEITVTATGGTGTITYSKDNGSSFQTSNVFSGLGAGTYQIKVKDANSCVSPPTAITISAPTAVAVSSAVKTLYNGAELSCATATDGIITVTPNGGTGTITYSKDNGANFQASNVFSGLAAGTYQIKVRDANSCISTPTAVTITAPTAVVISSAVKTLFNGAELSCATATDAVITVTATGGTGTITYSKDNGTTFQASNVFSDLAAGTYQIKVRDANSCISTPTAVTITAPNTIAVSSAVKTLYNGADLSCVTSTDGIITVTAAGGTGTKTYSKDNGTTFQASNMFSGLAAGTYQIKVRDANSCVSAPTAVTISAPTAVVISNAVKTLYNGAELSCATATDAVITVTATGGTGTKTYSKDNGANFQASNVFSGLGAGTYQIKVRDANSCVSAPTAVTISAPTAVVISNAVKTLYNTAELSCATATDGIITVTAAGGTGTKTYSKDNGTTFQASNVFSGLGAGTYQIKVRDANSCVSAATTVTITAPTAIAITSISSNSPICSGNTLNLFSTGSGGTGVKSYNWSGPNGFLSTLQNPSINNVSSAALGSYILKVTDINGCFITSNINIIINPKPTGSATPQSICSAGTTSVALNSTVIGTTFTWTAILLTSPAGGTITGQVGCAAACGSTIAQTLTNSGTTAGVVRYTVTPTANNCGGSTFTVDVTVRPKPVVTLTNITAQCSVTLIPPTSTDNCGFTITGTTGDPLNYNGEIKSPYYVNWSFDFGNGIVIVAKQTIVIDDTIAPIPDITSLPALNISNCQIDSLTPPTATDNCAGIMNGVPNITFPFRTQGSTIITWTYNDGNGNIKVQTQNLTLTAPSISGGSLKAYIPTINTVADASDNIAITSCPDDVNPITMNLSSETGTIVRWEKFEAGDTAWSAIANTSNSYNTNFNFSNTKSTLFRVLIQVGNCTEYSNILNVHAIPPDVPPTLDQNYFNICLNDQVTLVARSGYTSSVNVGDGGDYNTGQFPDKWDPTQWRIDGEVAGTAWTASANNRNYNNWSGTNNHPVGTKYKIEYDSNDFKFGIAHGNYNGADYISKFGVGPTTLETPIFSLVGLSTAAIEFDQAYNLHAGDICKLELSLDGGASYTVVLQDLIGTSPHALSWGDSHGAPVPYPYVAPGGNGKPSTLFNFQNDNSSFDISDYIGNENLRVKWTFFGTTDESAWAIDNITIPVRPYSDELEWTDGLGEPGEYIIRDKLEAAYTFAPTSPGVHQYGATSLINGCRAYDIDGTAIATVVVNYAYAGEAQEYTNEECGERTVKLNAYDNTKSASQNASTGAYRFATNTFSDDPGSGATGKWSVFKTTNTCGTYDFSDETSPNSSFSGDSGVYTLRWTLDISGCYSDVQATLTNCKVVDFDGTDDYISFKKNYGLGNAFSIEVWIKPDPQPENRSSNMQTIISKRNSKSLIDGYDLRLVGNTLSFNWNNTSQISSPFPLTTSRWYHVAVTFTGGIYRLYIDGIEVISAAGATPITNDFDCIAGAMDQTNDSPNKPVNHFSGWMDELRVWDVGLSPDHIRQMMNQQIINNAGAVRGEIIPIDINGPDINKDGVDDQPLTWSNLKGYYRMEQITCGYLNPFEGKGVDGKLRNITSSQEQTAPLPYVSIRDGNWTDRGTTTTPWKYGDSVWEYPNSTSYNGTLIDWNIVQIGHNINSGNKDITILGLVSTAGKLTIANPTVTTPIENNDGQGLWITHYLKLDGNIRLVGESQLVEKRLGTYDSAGNFTTNQFSESILDASSLGYIERDQQGKKNSYNYNYWSSPVSTIQGVINNTPHSIAGVLMDGTNSAGPQAITFGNGAYFADGTLTNPIKISNRWIWSYNSSTPDSNTDWDDYFQWNFVQSFGLLKVGEGFTMKGTGGKATIDATQNYVFKGKPNSGDITLSLPKIQTSLIGNPYPSALDADEFIKDNLAGRRDGKNIFSGALYFWDHFGLSNSHILAKYEGGYGTYTLTGGVPAVNSSSLTLNDGTKGSRTPERYIPVGQSFFVDADTAITSAISGTTSTVDGGLINFKNSQRIFVRETQANSLFMKSSGAEKIKAQESTDSRLKIRLGFDSAIGTHRQLLIGADNNATNQFDIGYDAPINGKNDNDMYWELDNIQLVIQAVPNFNDDQVIPIGLIVGNEGDITIKIDALENIPNSMKIYLFDNKTAIYHNIKKKDFSISLAIGEYKNRFSLQFENKRNNNNNNNIGKRSLDKEILVNYTINKEILNIQNNFTDTIVDKVYLFNILGQNLANWDIEDIKQNNIQIPIKNISAGVYIVKLKTSKGDFSKKIIIR